MLPPNEGLPSKPGEPSNVRARVVGGNRIDLQWVDNAYNEAGFKIERRVDGVYKEVGTVGANVTTFSDKGSTCNGLITPTTKSARYPATVVHLPHPTPYRLTGCSFFWLALAGIAFRGGCVTWMSKSSVRQADTFIIRQLTQCVKSRCSDFPRATAQGARALN
jgi:hypothetical protein